MSTTCKYLVFILLQKICQHIAVEDLLQLFAPLTVSNIPSIMFQQFCDIFLTEIRCLQCLQITVIRLKQIFDPLFAVVRMPVTQNLQSHMGHNTIFLKEIYQGFQIRHQKKLKNNFYVLDLVTFCTTLNSQKCISKFY